MESFRKLSRMFKDTQEANPSAKERVEGIALLPIVRLDAAEK